MRPQVAMRNKLLLIVLCLCAIVALSVGKQSKRKLNKGCVKKPCTVKSSPVCGTDGHNYTTRCHLSVARCQARKNGQIIKVASNGTCSTTKPFSACDWSCSEWRQKYGFCASNNITYKNLCQFKKAKCETRKKKMKPLVIRARMPCSKIKPIKTTCRDKATCPKVWRPVCGNDGTTYSNTCHLKVANCKRKLQKGRKYKKLLLKHCGPCNRPKLCNSSPWKQKCPSVKMCDHMIRSQLSPLKYVQDTQRRGSGKKSKANGKSKRKGKGKSKRASMPLRTSKKLKKKKGQLKGKKVKKGAAYPKFRKFMVCGSDGNNYASVCHLMVEQCNRKNMCMRLSLAHRGPCKT